MNNLTYNLKSKIILFILLLFIKTSYATDKINYNNFTLTNNELITESVINSIGIHFINTSFWFGTLFIAKKLMAFIKRNNDYDEYQFIGEDNRNNNKNMLINASLINLAETSLVSNFYHVIPNNYIALAMKALGYIGVIKFSVTKDKTVNDTFKRIMLLLILENMITILPNSLYYNYETKYPLENKIKFNAAGMAISATSALIISNYIYDLAFNKTYSPIKSLAFFVLSDITLGIVGTLVTIAVLDYDTKYADKSFNTRYQFLGYCIFTLANSCFIVTCGNKIKKYVPYLYSCLTSTYGFGSALFILASLISLVVKSDFFWGDTDSDVIGGLTVFSIPSVLLFVNTVSAIVAYKYTDKLTEKLQSSKQHLALTTINIISHLAISLTGAGLLSFSCNQPIQKSILFLNQMLLRKFYNITEYAKWILKI